MSAVEETTGNTIPIMDKPVDMMKVGINGNNLATSAIQSHPIDLLQQRRQVTQQRISFVGTNEEEEIRRLYGSGFAMKLGTECRMLQQGGGIGIGGGIVNSTNNVLADVLTGHDQTISFEDTLGQLEYQPTLSRVQEDLHLVMEHKLNM